MMNAPGTVIVAARRSYQDFVAWLNYLCQCHWDDIKARPSLASEIIVTQMHRLGLKNPSEQTSASIAAGIAVAEHGERVQVLSASDMTHLFLAVKAQSLFQGAYIAGVRSSRLQPQEVARIGISQGAGGMGGRPNRISEVMLGLPADSTGSHQANGGQEQPLTGIHRCSAASSKGSLDRAP